MQGFLCGTEFLQRPKLNLVIFLFIHNQVILQSNQLPECCLICSSHVCGKPTFSIMILQDYALLVYMAILVWTISY